MVKMNYVGFSQATAWDHALDMADFRSQMIRLGQTFRPGSPEAARYNRIARAIDDCAADWGFSPASLYAVGDGTTPMDRRNPYR